eukprot:m.340136 g.340136  ORF g.340136 m.340136 type:complete len:446 (+) comp19154_c0_seq1:16-1353(+)
MASVVLSVGVVVVTLIASTHGGAPPGPDPAFNDAGYLDVKDAFGTAHLFYWMFESRSNPAKDPIVLWMSGGPGCSGQLAMFGENGPYIIQEDLSLKINPQSWTSNATVIWIDQPVGAGFSYGEPPAVDEQQIAQVTYNFLVAFFEKYPKYKPLKFFIFGESYAGHYVPALSAKIVTENKKIGPGSSQYINYGGSAIGNGLTDPLVQFKYYPEYVKMYNHVTELDIKQAEIDIMEGIKPVCEALIEGCNNLNTTSEKWLACLNGYIACSYGELVPVELSGINLYDVREKCNPALPLCYNFTLIEAYLNQKSVQAALGVTKKWAPCNRLVDLVMVYAGDWMVDFNNQVELVLDAGFPVLIYAGEYDFICNWLGNHEWTNVFQWSGAKVYANASNTSWHVGGEYAGSFKSAQGLTFLKVRNAGHMVPRDQPVNSLDMMNRFIYNKTFN